MTRSIKEKIKKQRSLRQFNDFRPLVDYFDKISPDIKNLPKFKKVKNSDK